MPYRKYSKIIIKGGKSNYYTHEKCPELDDFPMLECRKHRLFVTASDPYDWRWRKCFYRSWKKYRKTQRRIV